MSSSCARRSRSEKSASCSHLWLGLGLGFGFGFGLGFGLVGVLLAPVVPRYALRTARPRPVRVRRSYRAWPPGASCPALLVRTARRRLARVTSTCSRDAGGTCQQRRALAGALDARRGVRLLAELQHQPWLDPQAEYPRTEEEGLAKRDDDCVGITGRRRRGDQM